MDAAGPPTHHAADGLRRRVVPGRSIEGFYVLAAAVLEVRAQQPTGELMRRLLGSRRATKLHWHEMDRLQQKDAAHRVAGIEGFHVVAVGTPSSPGTSTCSMPDRVSR
jgi:hypothetical protein